MTVQSFHLFRNTLYRSAASCRCKRECAQSRVGVMEAPFWGHTVNLESAEISDGVAFFIGHFRTHELSRTVNVIFGIVP
jgi:hypothetical protein